MESSPPMPHALIVRPRIHLSATLSIGPGKIDLLRQVGETRSIAAAARLLGIPYKRAWLMIESLNQGFGRPVVGTATGGKGGGGSTLTPLGQQLLARYAALEERINAASGKELEDLRRLLG